MFNLGPRFFFCKSISNLRYDESTINVSNYVVFFISVIIQESGKFVVLLINKLDIRSAMICLF